jgi:ribosomal protein S18 acetylase RimI-like enzyme
MVSYSIGVDDLPSDQLAGFFVGWPTPPGPDRLHAALRQASDVVLAWDGPRVIGFVYAISDGALAAYIPLLEVRPEHQGRGVGTELMARLLHLLSHQYMVDVVCDATLVPFYERLRGRRLDAVGWRNYQALSGA